MVAGQLADRSVVIRLAPALKARLLQARQRLQDGGGGDLAGMDGKDRVWRDGVKVEKVRVCVCVCGKK